MAGNQYLTPNTALARDEHWRLYGGGLVNRSGENIGFNLYRDGMFIDHARTSGGYWLFVKTRPEGEIVEKKLEKERGAPS